MRLFTFISLLIPGLGCASTKNAMMKPGKLNGFWELVRQELSSTLLPKVVFEKQRLIISDSTYNFSMRVLTKHIIP